MAVLCLLLTVILLFCAYKMFTRKHDVFKRRGVAYQKPVIFLGNMFDAFIWEESLESVIGILYGKFTREKLFGVFVLHRPIFVIKDVQLINQIEDSNYFSKHSGKEFNELDVYQKIKLELTGSNKSTERNKLNSISTFSSVAKLQEKLLKCARSSLKYVQKRERADLIKFDMKDVFEKFIAESIAAVIFDDRTNGKAEEILQVVKLIKEDLTSFNGSFKIMINSLMPEIFKMKIFRNEIHEFFSKHFDRNGFKKENNNDNDESSDHEQLSSQFLLLFTGGFEATQKLLEACFFELFSHQDVQAELIKEIDGAKNFSQLSSFSSLKILDKVIKETLRKNPPIKSFTRVCIKNCSISTHDGEVLKFIENDVIHIPIALIKNDDKIIRDPGKFILSRSEHDNEPFLSFGLSSNKCPGSTFVQLQAKALIFAYLTKYSVKSFQRIDDEKCEIELKCREK